MSYEHSCAYCRGWAICKDGLPHTFPETVEVDGVTYLTYDEKDDSWHPDARCIRCSEQVDCLKCGDQSALSPLRQLAECAE